MFPVTFMGSWVSRIEGVRGIGGRTDLGVRLAADFFMGVGRGNISRFVLAWMLNEGGGAEIVRTWGAAVLRPYTDLNCAVRDVNRRGRGTVTE